MPEAPIPSVNSILLCDRIINEEGTNKKTLVGVFDSVRTKQLPAAIVAAVYARITDAEGSYEFMIRVVHLKSNEKILEAGTPIVQIPNRLGYYELALQIPVPIPLPSGGAYELSLLANGVWIGRIVLNVETVK